MFYGFFLMIKYMIEKLLMSNLRSLFDQKYLFYTTKNDLNVGIYSIFLSSIHRVVLSQFECHTTQCYYPWLWLCHLYLTTSPFYLHIFLHYLLQFLLLNLFETLLYSKSNALKLKEKLLHQTQIEVSILNQVYLFINLSLIKFSPLMLLIHSILLFKMEN